MKVLFKSLVSIIIIFTFYTNTFPQDFQKCGTFSPENLAKIEQLCVRPPFYPASSEEQIIQTNNFNIHFITDEIPPLNPNEPPSDKTTWAYAEKVALAAQAAWNYQVNSLGWQAPPGDGTCGGGLNKYDIYIKRVNFYGETQPESQVAGTNGYTSYIIVTNGLIVNNILTPLTDNELKVTLAHEFNHAIQFGYNGTKSLLDDNKWFYENTSTWIEEIQYPEINDWITTFLNNQNSFSPLNRPHLPIDYFGNDYQYNGALFCHMLSRWFGNQFIRNIWQYAANSNNLFLSDIHNVLVSNGTNLKNALKKYAVWRFYTGVRDDGNHFPKGHLYNSSKILREHNTGLGSGNSSPDDLWSRGGTSYIVFKNADGVINLNFNGQNNSEFAAIALNKRIYFADVENNFTLDNFNDGTLNNQSCIGEDYVVLVPVVTDWQNLQSNISYTYNSTFGTGISTSFWTEKVNTNITQGTLSVQQSSPIISGHSRGLTNQFPYREKTNFERFPNFQGKSVKHNNWNNISSKYFLVNDFEASILNNRQSAKYENMEYSLIEARLEGNLISGKGYFEFQDPWYVKSDLTQPGNFWIPCLSFYEPNGKEGAQEKGVFLNQGLDWQPPYYSVKAEAMQDIYLNQTGRTHKFYFQGWSASPQGSAEFQNANALETPVVFKQANATVQANLKGTQLSNYSVTYSKGSQRRLINVNGVLYSLYESMDRVWMEKSSNNGQIWQIVNQGKPLADKLLKNPSMCNYGGAILIVAEELGFINIYQYNPLYDLILLKLQVYSCNENFTANPVIDYSFTQFAHTYPLIVWKTGNTAFCDDPKLYYVQINTDDWDWTIRNEGPINYSNSYSSNPTIAAYSSSNGSIKLYHIAWEQQSTIRYCKLNEDAQGNITQSSNSVISTGSSFMFHSSPSIIAIGTGARVCWLGYNDEDPPNASVIFRDPSNSRFWSFGSGASRPNINKSNDNTYYAFAWSQNNSTIKFADNSLSNVYEIIGILGRDVQVSNGNGKTNMFANIFKTTSQPYFFTMSNNLNHYYSIQKSNGLLVSNGRTGVLRKNNAEIYFALGDIKVNEQKVGFVECPVELEINNVGLLNQYLETEPFELNDNSNFEYTVQYGVVDTSVIGGMFQTGEQVRFKVELIDNNTGELLGVYDDVVYDQNNHIDFDNIQYQVNTQGIGQRTVKMRLRIEENMNPEATMVDMIDTESILGKSKRKQLQYQGETVPKEYALEQNYPNPFNPTTVISFVIPSGTRNLVTLKVYDVLGNEVATLVDEYKEAGRYKVEFDASGLASGVYIYKLTAGSFVSSKKMMVIK